MTVASASSVMLEAALRYARLGWPVLPLFTIRNGVCDCPERFKVEGRCTPGKHPRLMHGKDDASTDEATVRRWWRMWSQAGIAIDIERAGLVDIAPDSLEYQAQFIASGLPWTACFRSGGGDGHEHYLYRRPIDCPVSKINRPGEFDLLVNSYAVVPPTIHVSGVPYAWLVTPEDVGELPAAPAWAVAMLQQAAAKKTQHGAAEGLAETGDPPVRLRGAAVERWYGRSFRAKADGTPERSGSLYDIGRDLAEAGLRSSAILAACLRERDETLGWNKYTDRGDSAVRYDETAALVVQRAEEDLRNRLYLNGPPEYAASVNGHAVSGPKDSVGTTEPQELEAHLAAIPDYPTHVLPGPLRQLVLSGLPALLPAALSGGAALAAAAAAIGGRAQLEVWPGFTRRAIVWVPLMAPRGAGKSPSQERAFGPLRGLDAEAWREYEDQRQAWKADKKNSAEPVDPTVLFDDATLEGLARRLGSCGGMSAYDLDELKELSFGEYKRRPDSDRAKFLRLWTGAPWRYTRVGTGASSRSNAVDILIPSPTVVICGGIQTRLHPWLGDEEDGGRPRWLLHLAAMPDSDPEVPPAAPLAWAALLQRLVGMRGEERAWMLSPKGLDVFLRYQREWKRQARGDDNASTSAALVKADVQLASVTLVLAEVCSPGAGGVVSADIVESAAALVQFSMDCWRALPEREALALSRKDEALNRGVERLADWLEQHGGKATRRALLRTAAGGARTAAHLDQLLEHYQAVYPGTVREDAPAHGGPKSLIVLAPPRRSTTSVLVSADNAHKPHSDGSAASAENESPPAGIPETSESTADNGRADNGFADNVEVFR